MCLKKAIVCSIAIMCLLFVQSTAIAQTKSSTAPQGAKKATQNAPQIRTTAPEPIAGNTVGSKKKVIWGVLGAAAVIGLIAAVMGGGSSGGGKSNPPADDENNTGSVQVEW